MVVRVEQACEHLDFLRDLEVLIQPKCQLVRVESLDRRRLLHAFIKREFICDRVRLVADPPDIIIKLFMPAKLLRIASISDMRLILLLGLICPDLTGENANFVLVDIDEHLSAKDLPHNPLLVEIVEEHCRIVATFDLDPVFRVVAKIRLIEIVLLTILVTDFVLQQVGCEDDCLAYPAVVSPKIFGIPDCVYDGRIWKLLLRLVIDLI